MTAKDLFGVAIRVIGLVMVLYGLNAGLVYLTSSFWAHVVLALLLGYFFLRGGAPLLISVTYGRDQGAA